MGHVEAHPDMALGAKVVDLSGRFTPGVRHRLLQAFREF